VVLLQNDTVGGCAVPCRCRQQLHIQQHSVTSRILTRSQSCAWTTCLAFLPSVNPACPCMGHMSGNPQSHCFMRWVSFVISCLWLSSYVNVINEPVLVWWNSDPVVRVSLTFHHVACCTVGMKCEAVPSWYSPLVSSYLTACHIFSLLRQGPTCKCQNSWTRSLWILSMLGASATAE
jgi:hypothetical protein